MCNLQVSKRWQTLFTSKEIYTMILFPFFPFPLPDHGDGILSAVDLMRCKYGYSHSETHWEWPDGMIYSNADPPAEQPVSYCSGKVAWVTGGQRTACVLDLSTGASSRFMTESRGVIRFLHLSQHYLFVQASR